MPEIDGQLSVLHTDLGKVLRGVPDEPDLLLPGFVVVQLMLDTIGHDVPVEDHNVQFLA